MTKALIFGEYKFERFWPVLQQNDVDSIVVCSAVEFEPTAEFDWVTNVEVRPMRVDWTPEDVLSVLEEEAPSIAIANPYAHGQEQLPIVYAEAAERWAGRFVTHSKKFAEVACDKVALHDVANQRGWRVPQGSVCHDVHELTATLYESELPLVVKESQSQAGDGHYHLASGADIAQFLQGTLAYPVVVQAFLQGVEAGVELLSGDNDLIGWPIVNMGRVDADLDPSLHARYTPYVLSEQAKRELDTFVQDVQVNLKPFGPWQVDFLVLDSGGIAVVEINARFGGLSDMNMMSTGLDPHVALTSMSLGQSLPETPECEIMTMELPSTELPDVTVPHHPAGREVLTVTARSVTNRCFVGSDRMQLVATFGKSDFEAGHEWINHLDNAGLLRCNPSLAHSQMIRGSTTVAPEGKVQ